MSVTIVCILGYILFYVETYQTSCTKKEIINLFTTLKLLISHNYFNYIGIIPHCFCQCLEIPPLIVFRKFIIRGKILSIHRMTWQYLNDLKILLLLFFLEIN